MCDGDLFDEALRAFNRVKRELADVFLGGARGPLHVFDGRERELSHLFHVFNKVVVQRIERALPRRINRTPAALT